MVLGRAKVVRGAGVVGREANHDHDDERGGSRQERRQSGQQGQTLGRQHPPQFQIDPVNVHLMVLAVA